MIDQEAGASRSQGDSPRPSLTTNVGWFRAGGSLAPLGIWVAALALAAPASATQQPTVEKLPIKAARTISFETTEGTMMNVDVSPDGRTVLFDLLGDLYLVSITGGQAKQLTRGLARDLQPVWSPDGRRIAYVSDAGGSLQFWVMNADGSDPRPVSAGMPEDMVARLEWLPDGKAVAWEDSAYHLAGGSTKIAGLPTPGNRTHYRIETTFSRDGRYVYYNDDGLGTWERTIRGLMRVDRVTGDTLQLARPEFTILRPTVSPNGRWAAYVSDAGLSGQSVVEPFNGLRIKNLETGEERWLAREIDRARSFYERFAFTPDSRAIVIGYGGKLHRIDIESGEDVVIPFRAAIRAEIGELGHHRFRLPDDSFPVRFIRSPALSPDGKRFAFSAVRRLYTMETPNGTPARVAAGEEAQFDPAWSPDGKWLVYTTWNDTTGGHLWKIPATGGQPIRLTDSSGYYRYPVWSPDGARIAFFGKDGHRGSRGRWNLMLHAGGKIQAIGTERSYLSGPAVFSPDGKNILFQDGSDVISQPLASGEKRILSRQTPTADVAISPDGRYLAYRLHTHLYLAPLVPGDSGSSTSARAIRLMRDGAEDLTWDWDGKTLSWMYANRYYRIDPDVAMRFAADSAKQPAAQDPFAVSPVLVPHDSIVVRLAAPLARARGTVALRGARLITMKGDHVIENGTLVITNGRIVAVGPEGSTKIPENAMVIDVSGKTIIPGFIDLHAHYGLAPDWQDIFTSSNATHLAALAYGLTTARDPAGSPNQFGHAELIEAGRMIAPRLIPAGGNNHPSGTRRDSWEDGVAIARYRAAMGGLFVKEHSGLTRINRQWVGLATHRAGLNVTHEPPPPSYEHLTLLTVFLDGSSGGEHLLGWANMYGDVTRLAAESGTHYTPTLQIWAKHHFRRKYRHLGQDPKYRRFVPEPRFAEGDTTARQAQLDYGFWLELSRRVTEIARQGGKMSLGSHNEDHGVGVHFELWTLQAGGLTNLEALRIATVGGAEGLGLERDLGSLEVGKIADLIVLDQNPLEQIENTLAIRYVMKDGVLYDDDTLDTVWPEQRPLPPWMIERPANQD